MTTVALSQPATRALFVDLAGVLLDAAPPSCVAGRGAGLRGGAAAALRLLDRLDYRILALAPCPLERRHATHIAAQRLGDLLFRERIHLAGICCCGAIGAPCTDCPPSPNMLLRAAREHGLAMDACWLLGSNARYLRAGQQSGCRTILVGGGDAPQAAWQASHSVGAGAPAFQSRDIVDAALAIVRIDQV